MTKIKSLTLAALSGAVLAFPVFAQGDADQGEKAFNQCKSCHSIASDSKKIVKGGGTGPNLYGLVSRTAGAEDFRYSKILIAAGEKGLTWDEESFVGYIQNPSKWLSEYVGEKGRSKMTYKVRKPDEAADLWAYLSSVLE